mgnify:CR=1 FL=1
MATYETYFDATKGQLLPILYNWSDLTGGNTWASANTWEDWTNAGITSVGSTPDITYRTPIIDFGRVAFVNPLCTVQSVGDSTVKVFAANSIDSSSLLPGDPVIDGLRNQTLTGVEGRFFQFQIDVTQDSSIGAVNISSVTTTLDATQQTEYVQGDSATHSGTTAERTAPIVKQYSRIYSLTGTALYTDSGTDSAGVSGTTGESQLDPSLQYVLQGDSSAGDYVEDSYILAGGGGGGDDSEVPVVVVKDLSDASAPKYTVFTTNGTNRDHFVHLQIVGLPKMISDSEGNIVNAD